MKRLAQWMMRLYPAVWRARYGDEVDALLADSGADAHVVVDLLQGGVRMQLARLSFWKMALALGVTGMLAGFSLSFLITPEYTSFATMRMTPVAIQEGKLPAIDGMKEAITQMEDAVESRGSLLSIAKELNLYNVLRSSRPIEDVIEDVKRGIRIQFVRLPRKMATQAGAFNIEFVYYDRSKAQATVRALIYAFAEQNLKRSLAAHDPFRGYVLDVLDTASLPHNPVKPNRHTMTWAGGMAGFIAAAVIALFGRARHAPSTHLLTTNE
jgi:uncharacterized protein involved in exopolysaccharide biosynthesis